VAKKQNYSAVHRAMSTDAGGYEASSRDAIGEGVNLWVKECRTEAENKKTI
jgi:hypothetical protein